MVDSIGGMAMVGRDRTRIVRLVLIVSLIAIEMMACTGLTMGVFISSMLAC